MKRDIQKHTNKKSANFCEKKMIDVFNLHNAKIPTNDLASVKRPELPNNQVEMLITFIYYKDLQKGIDFYQGLLEFPLAVDQGFCKIYQISKSGYIGVVDEKKGMHNSHPIKPVQICMRVPDVDAFYEFCTKNNMDNLSKIFTSETLKIRAFTFNDPEGYQIEVQESIA